MKDKCDRLKATAEVLLGDESERADGKAAFEKWREAKRVRKDERAYFMGCSVQQPPRIDAPCAAFKLEPDAILNEHQEAIKAFVQVSCCLVPNILELAANRISGWRRSRYQRVGSTGPSGYQGSAEGLQRGHELSSCRLRR